MHKVTLRRFRSTWHWFHTNPQGGGFGSNHCGTKRHTLYVATKTIPSGAQYQLFVNEKDCGIITK